MFGGAAIICQMTLEQRRRCVKLQREARIYDISTVMNCSAPDRMLLCSRLTSIPVSTPTIARSSLYQCRWRDSLIAFPQVLLVNLLFNTTR